MHKSSFYHAKSRKFEIIGLWLLGSWTRFCNCETKYGIRDPGSQQVNCQYSNCQAYVERTNTKSDVLFSLKCFASQFRTINHSSGYFLLLTLLSGTFCDQHKVQRHNINFWRLPFERFGFISIIYKFMVKFILIIRNSWEEY